MYPAIMFAVAGCAWLPESGRVLALHAQPTYLHMTNSPDFAPGAATRLLNRIDPSPWPTYPNYCGLSAIVYADPGYQEGALTGSIFSRRTWVDLWSIENEDVYEFHLLRALRSAQVPYAALDFGHFQLLTLDSTATSYSFFIAHPDWQISDYVAHFQPCVQRMADESLSIVHHTIVTTQMTISFHWYFGLPARPNASTRRRLEGLGFKASKSGTHFSATTPWVIARSSALGLSNVGAYRSLQGTRAQGESKR